MKHCFQNIKLRSKSLALIEQANEIIGQYQSAGYRMTLRQLYYQFVSKNLLANTERNYKRLGSILNDGRYAGLVDWGAIEDRNRQPHKIGDFTGLESLANAALASYRLDRWKGQNYFVELWVEKAALAGVLQPLADEWHATLMVNRGYSSASAMFEAANRFRERKGQEGIVLYLGDHDPSGEDMVRDIQSRFDLFQVAVDVRKVALPMDQIREHHPPPNPAKSSDTRYDDYAAKHGIESWEVDALPPPVLEGLVRGSFQSIVTERELNAVLADERKDKKKFAEALDKATNGESEVDKRHLKVFKPPFE
jgi:hypothetical protein